MTAETKPFSKRPLGCGGALFLLFWLGLVVTGTIRSCTGDLAKAERLKQSDPCEAARLLATVVRRMQKSDASRALTELTSVPGPYALKQMIDLMDLPNSGPIGPEQREVFWKEIRIRTAGMHPTPPKYYDFAGEQETRDREKKEWESWFNTAYPDQR